MGVVVLGGGLSGLSAAYYFLKASQSKGVTLLESSKRTGGWIKSTVLPNGVTFEQGPRTIRPSGYPGSTTLELIEDLGLDCEIEPILRSHPATTNRMIFANGNLHTLPANIKSLFVKKEPFTKPLVLHLLKDIGTSRKKIAENDESIYDFTNRRFGTEVAEYLISPLICGICAGNAKEISVHFLMKSMFEMEQKHGSITRGLINSIFTKSKNTPNISSALLKKAQLEKWGVYSFKKGMETLPRKLENELLASGCSIEREAEATEIQIDGKNVLVRLTNDRYVEAEHLISSLPAPTLAGLVEKQHSKFAKLLQEIKFVTVAVVNFSFSKKLIPKDGFGFLVAPKENLPILGVIYDTCCFPKGDNTVFTVMMGGYWFEEKFGLNPTKEHLRSVALQQLKNILKFDDDPEYDHVNILQNCIPQYTVGHSQRIENIFKYISDNNLPLSLCGSSYGGVGVNDVILSAKIAVYNLDKKLL